MSTTGNADATVAMLTITVAARCNFFVKSSLHFHKFLVNFNFDLETDYIFGKPMNRCVLDIVYCLYGNIVNFACTS